ncbi:insulinase family protein [Nonomuraea sp. MG754425]|uniref:M16 family metallopeptidase n=1 Tax=Nonomuraea sp. MG754425 TaxID=2570319 RepID=UPI001F2DED3C|nr:pitrilysin family protein [Nonomuraea sp. MG754425]MCF6473561.1 insulinase family protein [Nonomuraea sp. MG754425]
MTVPEVIRLDNGLRVVLDPHGDVGAAGVTVLYGTGGHDDRPGSRGLAHLVEHLMFQGSARYGALAHFHFVQGVGGAVNAQTLPDYTEYYQQVPADCLDELLTMEADRMAGLAVTEPAFGREIEVIKQEVSAGLADSMARFPWRWLAPVMFPALDGRSEPAGLLEDLDTLTLAQARAFFTKHYVPGAAVLAVTGDFDPSRTADLIAGLFGVIPAGPLPERVPLVLDPLSRRHHTFAEFSSVTSACAVAWPTPPELGGRMPTALAIASRLLGLLIPQRLTAAEMYDVRSQVSLGVHGLGQNCRPPSAITAAFHVGDRAVIPTVLELAEDALAEMARGRVEPESVERARRHELIMFHQGLDSYLGRARWLASGEYLRGAAGRASWADELLAVTREDLAATAGVLLADRPVSLELVRE